MKNVARIDIALVMKEDELGKIGLSDREHYRCRFYGIEQLSIEDRRALPPLNLSDAIYSRMQEATALYHEDYRRIMAMFANLPGFNR